jgi:hypothetical protein
VIGNAAKQSREVHETEERIQHFMRITREMLGDNLESAASLSKQPP